jgi:hypothetical protein
MRWEILSPTNLPNTPLGRNSDLLMRSSLMVEAMYVRIYLVGRRNKSKLAFGF